MRVKREPFRAEKSLADGMSITVILSPADNGVFSVAGLREACGEMRTTLLELLAKEVGQ